MNQSLTLTSNRKEPPVNAGGACRPWVTLTIILLSLPFSLAPPLFELGYFDQALIQQGQFWRLLTGHLSHTSLSHLQWDLLAFALAAGYLERHSRTLLLLSLLAAITLLDLHLLSNGATIQRYAGLSGILFAPLIISLVLFAQQQSSINGWLPLLICLSKLVWELGSQQALLSQSPWPAYPLAHLIGALAGFIILLHKNRLKKAPLRRR
ncbi:rhombosortase [Amphritea sp. 1_MG-2023]|uniref:rhombosortase n=1 Tax=Amphritea sp. 1_MG-2023 TaxID=3062670 RepID=UPI0026E16B96|nr:rhombosortase [Amphritea sp. 1_MG-2023]MDO6563160.1 rhombosortase [Amphritea sp. 1_MG-2023]